MSEKIGLRVFKRDEDKIILFWNTDLLNEDQRTGIKLFLLDRADEFEDPANTSPKDIASMREIKFRSTDATKEKELNTSKNVAIAVIGHAENNIDPNGSILFKLELGAGTKIHSFLRVTPAGVLPYFERDEKKQNFHLFGFSKEKNRWGKVPLVKTKNGGYAIPIVICEAEK